MASKLIRNTVRVGIVVAIVVIAALASSWLQASLGRHAFDRVSNWFGGQGGAVAETGANAAATAASVASQMIRDQTQTLPPPQPVLAEERGGIEAAVVVGGVVQTASGGRIALPSGSRFQLSLRSDRDGVAEVYSIAPDGRSSDAPLWSGRVRAGSDALTPEMRLQGQRGVETLRVLLRGDGASPTGSSLIAERRVLLWHL